MKACASWMPRLTQVLTWARDKYRDNAFGMCGTLVLGSWIEWKAKDLRDARRMRLRLPMLKDRVYPRHQVLFAVLGALFGGLLAWRFERPVIGALLSVLLVVPSAAEWVRHRIALR